MGRGSSKNSGGVATSVMGGSGEKIDLTDIPLQYGKKDATLTGKERKNVEEFEKKRVSAKTEYAVLLDENGDRINTKDYHGGKGSVKLPHEDVTKSKTMSHNHPRGKGEEGTLGGTFSGADTRAFSHNANMQTMRATAAEGTYSISKTKDFKSHAFRAFHKQSESKHMGEYKKTAAKIQKDLYSNKITPMKAKELNSKAFNKAMVNMHNDLLGGQKTYGYTYTLEQN